MQSLGVIIGIIVGGYWTYRGFVQNRQKYPRANLSHKIFFIELPNNKKYLQVKVIITNIGNVLICLECGFTRITQILPFEEDINEFDSIECEIEWPMIDKKSISSGNKKCEIEPGESDELNFDFIIDSDINLINIYSYFSNIKKKSIFSKMIKRERDIGWQITTIYNLKEITNSCLKLTKINHHNGQLLNRSEEINQTLRIQRAMDKKVNFRGNNRLNQIRNR